MNLKSLIPTVPDWPLPGVNFLDITAVLENPRAFAYCISTLGQYCSNWSVTSLIAVESRGFPFASALAIQLGLPLILARKHGKLPGAVYSQTYSTEYSQDQIEIQQSSLLGSRPVIVDDLLATGGTILAVADLVRQNFSVDSVQAVTVINLSFLPGHQALKDAGIAYQAVEVYE